MEIAQPSTESWRQYWLQSRRPLVSLVFIAHLLLLYEAGIVWLGPQALRNGVDVWLRDFLQWLGFGQYLLLPLATCAVLLGWHHLVREPWRFRWSIIVTMLLECCLLAAALLLLAQIQGQLFWATDEQTTSAMTSAASARDLSCRLIAYCGAGIYEELLFRLLAIPAAAAGLKLLGMSRGPALIGAVVTTSLLFALAHYSFFTAHGEPFAWYSFTFRLLAGMFFATLFAARGFGIAAGAHAYYDILIAFC